MSNNDTITDRVERGALVLLWIIVLSCGTIATLSGPDAFAPYFGNVHPLIAIPVALLAGSFALRYLADHGWLRIHKPIARARGMKVAAVWATVLGAMMILADVRLVLPADINVAPPQSVTFYPTMAFVAEVVFHLVPLALLLVAFGQLGKGSTPREKVLWFCLLFVALLEPLFQVRFGADATWLTPTSTYVGIQVLMFNLVSVWLFRSFGFLTAYSFRIVYYLYWHILWGWARLHFLF